MDREAINAAASDYARRFDDAAAVQAKALIITMVPMFAVLLGLVQVLRRRPHAVHPGGLPGAALLHRVLDDGVNLGEG